MERYSNRLARKVPEITTLFWVVKILTTAMGESTADYLDHRISPILAVLIAGSALLLALLLQFYVKKYIAWVYWLAVSMVAVFGTMAADGLHVRLGIPYGISTSFFAIALALIFIYWHRSEKTLSIHSVNTKRREMFYWATVLATFALGTAAGDMTATTLGLGYFTSGLLFTGLIIIPAMAYRFLRLNEVVAFWAAYVLTRPLGASFADWFGVPRSLGGLGIGRGVVSIILTSLIVIVVVYMSLNKAESKHEYTLHR